MSSEIFNDCIELAEFADEVKRTPRQVYRWLDEPDGLPHIRIGNRILLHAPTVRTWLMGRMRQRNPSPKRGRRSAHRGN